MQFSVMLAFLAILANITFINASPTLNDSNNGELEARGPRGRPTQQECEVACTLSGFTGAQWQQCVRQCMASNYPSPPPTPQNRRKPKGKRNFDFEVLETRARTKNTARKSVGGGAQLRAQAECRATCSRLGLTGDDWKDCIHTCLARKAKSKRDGRLMVRARTKNTARKTTGKRVPL